MTSHKPDFDYDRVDPRPSSLVAALRSIGYSLATAIADLIDNSITAGATKVRIAFTWRGANSCVSICDNGRGMTESELVEAMRPGSHDPLWQRSASDLGRFGLGLKTASFSQCRVFSVISKCEGGNAVSRTWDLDLVINENRWWLRRDMDRDAAEEAEQLRRYTSGTCVVWKRLDRLVGNAAADDDTAHRAFLEAADRVCDHLAMVFGDYLKGRDAIELYVGNKRIQKWDPFLESYDTQIADEEVFDVDGKTVRVRPFVLPHSSRLDKKAFEAAGGPAGWNAQQGFYIYRNRRMLVAGGWLNLGLAREEHLKLARIRVDIDTGSDALWQLDIKKARATPPVTLRDDMRRIARLTRSAASEVYRHRGKKIIDQADNSQGKRHLWQIEKLHNKLRYRIDREHPIVKALIEEGQTGKSVNSLLTLIEETIPGPSIYISHAEKPNEQPAPFEHTSESTVKRILRNLFITLREAGNTVEQARATLSRMTPFDTHPELIAGLADQGHPHQDEAAE